MILALALLAFLIPSDAVPAPIARSALDGAPPRAPVVEAAEPETHALFDAAVVSFQAGKCDEAFQPLKTLAAMGFRSSETSRALRSCYEKLHGIDGAIAKLEEEVRVNPGDAVAHSNLGVFYLAQQRKDDSQRELLAALKLAPKDLDARLNLAFWYSFVGQSRAAVSELENVLKDDPENARAVAELCFLISTPENDPKRALPYCEQAAAGGYEPAGIILGTVLMRTNDFDGAEKAYQAVLQRHPESHEARNFYGVSRLRRGDIDGAMAAFRETLAASPDNVAARIGLAHAYQERKEFGAAVKELQAAYDHEGGAMLLGALARAYLQQYFYLTIGLLLLAMGLLLWRYLNVKVPEIPGGRRAEA